MKPLLAVCALALVVGCGKRDEIKPVAFDANIQIAEPFTAFKCSDPRYKEALESKEYRRVYCQDENGAIHFQIPRLDKQ